MISTCPVLREREKGAGCGGCFSCEGEFPRALASSEFREGSGVGRADLGMKSASHTREGLRVPPGLGPCCGLSALSSLLV
jgi:hypothetical protein